MKKTTFIMALALLSLPAFSFAATNGASSGTNFVSDAGGTISGTKTGGSAQKMGQLSSNVTLNCVFSTSTFSATAKHLNGSKEYGSSSGSTKIFSKDLAAGTPAPTVLSDSTDAAFTTGWTSM